MDELEGRRGRFNGFPFRREADARQGLQVVAEGSATIHNWLKLKHLMASDETLRIPIGNGQDDLRLGILEIGDRVSEGLTSSVVYDDRDLSYVLGGGLMLKVDIPNVQAASLDVFLGNRQSIRSDFNFNDYARSLRRSLSDEKYSLERSSDEEFEVSLKDEPEKKYSVSLRQNELLGIAEALVVRFRGDMEEDGVEAFSANYQHFAEVLGFVANSYYAYKREAAPEKTLVLTPPKNTEVIVKNASNAIKTRRKMLASSGLIDGDDDLMEEIEAKIKLERRPQVTFDDIGGNEKAKQELLSVVHALKDPEAYRRWGTSAPRGILLYGEPGTGKTLLAKALANKAEAGIYVVQTSDVLHSLYGKTERLIQAIFDRARQNTPVIIFFDELDALAGNRDHSTEVTSRIVSVLLTNMDGLEETDSGIIVVGTTNRLQSIDPALRRPGRFDLPIEVPMPDKKQRESIFRIHADASSERAGREIFEPNLDLELLADGTTNFSGADIKEIIRRTGNEKVRQEEDGLTPGPITTNDLLATIKLYENIRLAKKEAIGFQSPTKRS